MNVYDCIIGAREPTTALDPKKCHSRSVLFFLLFTYYDYVKVVFIDVLLIHHKIVHVYKYYIIKYTL